MGFRLRWSNHLAKCHVLCWYDGIPRTTCSNQSGFPQWGTREKFPSTPTTRTGCPKRRGLCKGYSGPHSSTTDLLHHGPTGHATIIGCLKYGACFSGLDDQDDPVFLIRLKDEDLLEAPDDSAFLQSLRISTDAGGWLTGC